MQSGTELDLEIVDAGTAYTLYAASLVNLAIEANKGSIQALTKQKVEEYAEKLKNTLFRCKVDIDVPNDLIDANKILPFLQKQILFNQISAILAREHSHRQENIFTYTVLLSGIIYADVGGAGNAADSAKSAIKKVADKLSISEQQTQQYISERSLNNFRNFIAKAKEGAPKVFLVHGHNDEITQKVARFIEKLDIVVIILREQPNSGRAIIEKFIDYSNVDFAVILLTDDDQGGLRGQSYDTQKPRARQNVIFELGFFIGKLGRNRVCTLYKEGVEIPSDYSGVIFVPIDEYGAWKQELVGEMKEAGIPVDMNKIFN